MKKKLLSWFLVMIMAMGLLPTTAFAEDAVGTYDALIASIESAYASQDLFLAWENVGLQDVAFAKDNEDAAALAAIEAISAEVFDASSVMKGIFTLEMLGYDPTDITLVDETKVNGVSILNTNADANGEWYFYTAPYALLALTGQSDATQPQIDAHIKCLVDGIADIDYTWGMDTPAMTVMGLAPYYSSDNAELKTAVDGVLSTIASSIGEGGTYGNSNTDAMVILAYAMLGIDPATITIEDTNLVEGFLAYQCADGSGFGFTDTDWNQRATYQGLLALKALAAYEETKSPVNPFDFSGATLVAIDAEDVQPEDVDSGSGSGSGGSVDKTIDVTFAVEADDRTWFSEDLELEDGDTVKIAFLTAFDEHSDYDYEIDGGTYVESITHPSYGTYGEFTHGTNSGWKYSVNDEVYEVAFSSYTLDDDDEVVFYYVMDYTTDSTGSSDVIPEEEVLEEVVEEVLEEVVDETEILVVPDFDDVAEEDWFYSAVVYALTKGLFYGTEEGSFAPHDAMTRAMVWTVLARIAGAEADADAEFWYQMGLDWAMEAGISDGTNPDGGVTREELAAMLYRYEKSLGGEMEVDLDAQMDYDDMEEVSDWAKEAVRWMVSQGILAGTSETTLSSKNNATRAEVAAILMRYLERKTEKQEIEDDTQN